MKLGNIIEKIIPGAKTVQDEKLHKIKFE